MIGMRLGLRFQPTPVFRLSSVANLVADWNPLPDAVTKDGSNLVSQCSDASGNGNHFLQASGAAKPTWVSSLASANNAPALQLSGAQYMQLGLSSQLDYDRTQAWTMGAVVRVTGSANDQCILAKGNPISIGYGMSCGNGATTANLRAGLAASGANRIVGDGSIALKDTTRIIRVTYDGSSSVSGVKMYVDGASVTVSPTVNSLSSAITSANKFTLGWNAIAAYLTGYFMRGFLYSRVLSAAEGTRIDRMLGRKYGITVA